MNKYRYPTTATGDCENASLAESWKAIVFGHNRRSPANRLLRSRLLKSAEGMFPSPPGKKRRKTMLKTVLLKRH
jgi:hypothetical protein